MTMAKLRPSCSGHFAERVWIVAGMTDIGDRGRRERTEGDIESPIQTARPNAGKGSYGKIALFELGLQFLRLDEERWIVGSLQSQAKHSLSEANNDQPRQPGAVDRVEQEDASRLQHPPDFADHRVQIANMLKHIDTQDNIDRVFGDRQVLACTHAIVD